jgi:hypothetical protein
MRGARRADGFSNGIVIGVFGFWTSSSEKSTRIPRMRGELFPRIVEISAKVDYDLSATDNFGILNDWGEEGKSITRWPSIYSIRLAIDFLFRILVLSLTPRRRELFDGRCTCR